MFTVINDQFLPDKICQIYLFSYIYHIFSFPTRYKIHLIHLQQWQEVLPEHMIQPASLKYLSKWDRNISPNTWDHARDLVSIECANIPLNTCPHWSCLKICLTLACALIITSFPQFCLLLTHKYPSIWMEYMFNKVMIDKVK